MVFPMESDTIPSNRGKLIRVAESLYQYTHSKEYYARFRSRGKHIQQKLGTTEAPCTTLSEARRKLRDLKSGADSIDPNKINKTLGKVIDEYEAVLNCSEKTRVYKKLHLGRLRTEFPLPSSTTKVRTIQKTDVMRFMAQYNHLAPASWNAILTVARDVFAYAVDDEVIFRSPVIGKDLTYRKRPDCKKLTPSYAEYEAIVANVRSQKLADTAKESADLLEFMGLAGLGQAECADLTWADINFSAGKIAVIRRKTQKEFSVPIFPSLLPLLQRMNNEREDKTPTAKLFSVKDPKVALAAACRRLNFPNYSARSLRRMFITRCVNLGIDPKTIAGWQGHRDGGKLILQVYAQHDAEHERRMASKLIAPTAAANVVPMSVDAA
jgi:integrase